MPSNRPGFVMATLSIIRAARYVFLGSKWHEGRAVGGGSELGDWGNAALFSL